MCRRNDIVDKDGDIGLEFEQGRHVDVHHVASFVFFHRDSQTEFGGEPHVGKSIFGGEERCGEIVIAVGYKDLYKRGCDQRRSGELC